MDVDISVIIPVYNEEDCIIPLYNELNRVLQSLDLTHEIIFIEDGSTDSTYKKLLELHECEERIRIIKFRRNFGQSAAIGAGFDHARGDTIITMDADLQNDPKDIPNLINKMKDDDLDVVCGWRFNRKDVTSKKLLSKIANVMRRAVTNADIHDSGCTLRAYGHEAILGLDLYGEMHRYIPEILSWKGYKIGELKVNHRARRYGKTKYNWRRILRGFLDLVVVSFWQKYSTKPIHLFGGLGVLLTVIGTIISSYLVMEKFIFGATLSNRPLFILSIIIIVIGMQFISFGLLADISIKIYYNNKGIKPYLIERVIQYALESDLTERTPIRKNPDDIMTLNCK